MRGVIFIVLSGIATLSHGRVADQKDDFLDNLLDSFSDRALALKKSSFQQVGLDNTTASKAGSLALASQHSASTQPISLYSVRSSSLKASLPPSHLASRRYGSPASRTSSLKAVPSSRALGPGAITVRSRSHTNRIRSSVVPRADAGQQLYIEKEGFDISKISFGTILASVGASFLLFGFGSYIQILPGADLGGVLLIYGVPASLLGAALKYAELKPLDCKTTKAAFDLRDSQMTDILKQVREDVTRYRYGDEQHLDLALERIFKIGRPDGIARSQCPRLVGIREETVDGMYALVLEFENKQSMDKTKWDDKNAKFQSFFGPGVTAVTKDIKDGKEVSLIVDGSGAGRGGGDDKEVLPPLMPGLAPRVVEKGSVQ